MNHRIVSKDKVGIVGKFMLRRSTVNNIEFRVADTLDAWYTATGSSIPGGIWNYVVGVYDSDTQRLNCKTFVN